MKAVAYLRVSTNEQASSGFSLPAQEAKIRSYCSLYDIELVEVISDPGFSAKDLKRPGIQKILSQITARKIEGIVCLKLDRLTRNIRDLSELIEKTNKYNVALISVEERLDTSTASGRMVINMMGTISQWEREAIGERTRTALQFKKSQGQCIGTIPLGYRRKGDNLIPDPKEQQVLSTIRKLRKQGYSYRQIGSELEKRNILTKKGCAHWPPRTIQRLCRAA